MARLRGGEHPATRFLVGRLVGLIVAIVVCLVGLAVYSTYKFFIWPQVQAVVTSIEPICIYAKKTGRRSVTKRYLSCDAVSEAEAVGLIAEGYKLWPKEALVEAVYEGLPGRKVPATLRPWWDDVSTLSPGSVVQIRYSPFTPHEAELITGGERAPVVILGFFVGAVLLACLLAVLTYEGDDQAASRSR